MENSFRLGNKLKQQGKLEEAVTSYVTAIGQNPNFYWSYHNLGEVLLKLGRWEEAVNNYRKAIALNPNSAWSHYYLGEALTQLDSWAEAATAYHYAIKIDPNSYPFYNNLGKTLYQISLKIDQDSLGQYIDLAQLLFDTYQFKGEQTELIFLNDELFLQANNHLKDKDFIEQVYRTYLNREGDQEGITHYYRELANGMSRAKIILGLRSSQEFKSKLCESLRETNLQYLSDELFIKATEELENEKFVEQVYRTYLKREPDTGGKNLYVEELTKGISRQEIIYMFKGSSEYGIKLLESIKFLYLQKAIGFYQTAKRIYPKTPKITNNLQEANNKLAKLLEQQGKHEEAIQVYKQAISMNPSSAEGYYNQGILYLQNGQIEEALEKFKKTISINPNYGEAYYYMASVLNHKGLLNDAIDCLKKALQINPSWAEAYQSMGNILHSQQKFDQAIELYERALSLQPNWAGTHISIAYVFLAKEEFDNAIEKAKIAIEINPNWYIPYNFIGYVLLLKNQIEEALKFYEKAISIEPNNIFIYNQIANELYIGSGQLDISIEYWKRALKVQKNMAEEKYGLVNHKNCHIASFMDEVWVCRIGHMGFLPYYIKMQLLGWLKPQKTILSAPYNVVANKNLLNYLKPYFQVVSERAEIQKISSEYIYSQQFLNLISIRDEEPQLWWYAAAEAQEEWEKQGKEPIFKLSESDQQTGQNNLLKLGVPKDAWFVCLHVREAGFHKESIDFEIRNVEIDTYLLAIDKIIQNGGWVIRMGDPSMKPLPPMKQVIDYAHSELKSDDMDIFLSAECRFFLGTNSGLFLVSTSFGVPCILTNWAPLECKPWESETLFIPKLFWREKEKQYITFTEQMSPPLNTLRSLNTLSMLGIKLIDNTAEEICEVVEEMLMRVDGSIKYTKEDEFLQVRFNNLAKSHKVVGQARIGRSFLNKYAKLFPT